MLVLALGPAMLLPFGCADSAAFTWIASRALRISCAERYRRCGSRSSAREMTAASSSGTRMVKLKKSQNHGSGSGPSAAKVEMLTTAFRSLDVDGDGVVSLAEMRHVMMELGDNPLSAEEWEDYVDFFNRADADGNGELTVEEYIKASLEDI